MRSTNASSRCTELLWGQEAEAAASVSQQVEAFRRDMAKDGGAQRGEVRRLVQGFTQRAQGLVDSTLKVCLRLLVQGQAHLFSWTDQPVSQVPNAWLTQCL